MQPPGPEVNDHDLVPISQYLRLLRERTSELVDQGVNGSFLAHCLARYVEEQFARYADTAEANEARAEMRQALLERADDPLRMVELAETLEVEGEDVPSIDEMSDSLRRLADTHLAPVTAEQATSAWANLDSWRREAADLLALTSLDFFADYQ